MLLLALVLSSMQYSYLRWHHSVFLLQILKCFYALIQFCLPLDLISRDAFSQWMDICRQIISQPLPTQLSQVDPDDLSETIWWKIRKWCMHILVRTFER